MGLLTREDYKKILDDMNTSPITRTILDFAERVEEEVRKKLTGEEYEETAKQQAAELQAALAAARTRGDLWQQEWMLEQQKHNKAMAEEAEEYAKLKAEIEALRQQLAARQAWEDMLK